jgi:hypothetical protein
MRSIIVIYIFVKFVNAANVQYKTPRCFKKATITVCSRNVSQRSIKKIKVILLPITSDYNRKC